jgi:SAM-dependent methyltransferase
MKDPKQIKDEIRRDYARIITQKTSCCGPGASAASQARAIGYEGAELQSVPEGAATASFGCGNPLALAELKPGEVVLDLGSGAGLDVLLASRQVGPSGKVYGLDMTPEMIAQARKNLASAGIQNVEILEGDLEAIPLPGASVDLVISNCVINLAADKKRAFREIFRVLKLGGRFSVSDLVTHNLPPAVREKLPASGCIALALEEEDYLDAIGAAGFGAVKVTSRAPFNLSAEGQLLSSECGCGCGCGEDDSAGASAGQVISLTVQGRKEK